MTREFGRFIEVTFGDNERSFGWPFTIEMESRHQMLVYRTVTLKLYNPNNDTIAQCKAAPGSSGKIEPRKVRVACGYLDSDDREIMLGVIKSYTVEKTGTERILTIEMQELPEWNSDLIGVVKENLNSENDIRYFLMDLTVGGGDADPFSRIQLGEASPIRKIAIIEDPLKAVRKIAKQTKSVFYFSNGRMHFMPEDMPVTGSPQVLAKHTGLLKTPKRFEIPKKQKKRDDSKAPDLGYELETIYKATVNVGDAVSFPREINSPKGSETLRGVVIEATKSMSTRGAAASSFRAKEFTA